MSYYIDIIDTLSPLVQIVPKSASAKGIVLEWNGSDTKDEQPIVGSNLKFDMLTVNDDDAAFIDFFTGDEHRFKTVVKNSVDDAIVWQGYILPDLYSEPYKNVNFFVQFTASDGLGRLKGKYLPNEYYSREKSLTDIFTQILRLTGLELELFFAPAIENTLQKNWHNIYIDTESFVDKNKKQDAYKIFETLLNDTVCVCYQCDNRWYIEGINMRQIRKISYKKYDAVGNYLGNVVYDRVLKTITALVTPTVTMIPPYNEITITHPKTMPEIPKTASKEKNDGWVVTTGGGNGIIDCSDWVGHGNYFAKAVTPNYDVVIYNQFFFDNNNAPTYTQDNTKYISLRKKIFLSKTDKIKFVLDFKIVHPKTGNQGSPAVWNNVFKYEIVLNDVVVYSNFGGTIEDREDLIFEDSGTCKIQIEHFFAPDASDALLDIKLYRPNGRVADNGVLGIALNEVSAEIINFTEEVIETNLINGDFTIDKELELTYGEDKSGFSNGFRLAKLKEETTFWNEFDVYILDAFTFNSKFYSQVLIEGANLIKENQYQVYYLNNLVEIIDVVYNLENSTRMVVETRTPITSGNFVVRKYAVDDLLEDRSHWVQWSDAFYKIENNSYTKTVANIFRRLFNIAHEKIEVTALNAVKFNDLVLFHYVFMKDFVVLNCSWNLDENKTDLILGRAIYKDYGGADAPGINIPPIVVATNDIYIQEGVTSVNISATAYDPDGFVESQIWTKTVGDSDAIIVAPESLTPSVIDLAGDFYTFQIEVTDNQGATATDTVNIIRIKNYTVTLDLIDTQVYDESYRYSPYRAGLYNRLEIYKLNITPELPVNTLLKLTGKCYLYARGFYLGQKYGGMIKSLANYTFFKNGTLVEGNQVLHETQFISQIGKLEAPIEIDYIAGDEIIVNLVTARGPQNRLSLDGQFKAKANIKLLISAINSNIGTIVGLPIEKENKIADLARRYLGGKDYEFYERDDL